MVLSMRHKVAYLLHLNLDLKSEYYQRDINYMLM